jgi:hypothetical protein
LDSPERDTGARKLPRRQHRMREFRVAYPKIISHITVLFCTK